MPGNALFSPLTTTDELLEATGEGGWLQAMLDAEAALAWAEAEAGVIPFEAAEAIAARCRAELFDPASIGRAGRAGGNPVIPLVAALSAEVPPPGKEWVHWGATSQDVLDTAACLVAKRAGALIAADLARLAAGCAALADAHRRTLMVGRTLLQPATPITFGLKAAGWLSGITHCQQMLRSALASLAAQLGGAAGTLASLGAAGPAVAAAFAARLELAEPALPWHTARQRVAALAGALATVAGSCAKITGDVALLMQAEVAEAAEPPAAGRGGSSTMPHKRNPVGAVAVGAAARRALSLLPVLYGTLVAEHERAAGAWQAEWESLSELLALAGGAAARTADVIEGLQVYEEAMAANLQRTGGVLLAEAVALALAGRMGRAEARAAVEAAARRVGPQTTLADALSKDPTVSARLEPGELGRLLDPGRYLGATEEWIGRALSEHERASGAGGAQRQGVAP